LLHRAERAASAPLSARETILQLLDARPGEARTAATLSNAAESLGIAGAAVRVALRRLVADGDLVSPERGVYAVGPRREAAQRLFRDWRRAEERLAPWSGAWRLALCHQVKRQPARAFRGHLRALRFNGFVEAEPGLWARADNLAAPAERQFEELAASGLAAEARLLVGASVDPATDRTLRGAHDRIALEKAYRTGAEWLEEARDRLKRLPEDGAMALAFNVGREAIRSIASDPLLPAELIDAAARASYFAAARAFVDDGHALWERAGV